MDIIELLESKGFEPIHCSGFEYKIRCINQMAHSDGADDNPSLYINVEKQKAYCQTCGFKLDEAGLTQWLLGGHIDDFMLQAIKIKSMVKHASIISDPFLNTFEEFCMLPPTTPWIEDYRGISKEFFKILGAGHCTKGRYANRIILPIYVNCRLRGFDSRALGNEKPKYLRSSGFDSTNEGLYPFDYVTSQKPKYVIVCEGIFDAINACSKGFPALCIFGTQMGLQKFSLLLSTGVTEVIMFMDNDAAGNSASDKIIERIKGWITTSVADKSLLVGGKDLGDLSADEIQYCIDNRRVIK